MGGALDSQFYSKTGVFNGTGLALIGETTSGENRRVFTLYFQHWTGDIRYMHYTAKRKWIGGTRAQTIAVDARNATPISTVSYTGDGVTTVSSAPFASRMS